AKLLRVRELIAAQTMLLHGFVHVHRKLSRHALTLVRLGAHLKPAPWRLAPRRRDTTAPPSPDRTPRRRSRTPGCTRRPRARADSSRASAAALPAQHRSRARCRPDRPDG